MYKCKYCHVQSEYKYNIERHEKSKHGSSSRTSLQEETECEFSLDTTSKTYEVSTINEELVIKRLKMNNDEYNNKMELGKIIAKAIKDGEIAQDSLCSEDSEALHLYWNKKQLMNIDNVILKTLQTALLHYMKCEEGKTF